MLMFAQRCTLTNSAPLFGPRGSPGHTWCLFRPARAEPAAFYARAHSQSQQSRSLALRQLAENCDRSASAVVLARPPSVELLQCWDEPRRGFQRAVSDEVLPQHLHADARALPVLDVVWIQHLQLQNSGGESKRLITWPRLAAPVRRRLPPQRDRKQLRLRRWRRSALHHSTWRQQHAAVAVAAAQQAVQLLACRGGDGDGPKLAGSVCAR